MRNNSPRQISAPFRTFTVSAAIQGVALCLWAVLAVQPIAACDVCGCGIGGPSTGLSPFFDRSFLGVRLGGFSTESHLTYGRRFRTSESFMRTEVFARIRLSDEFLLQGSVPWAMNRQSYKLSGDSFTNNGFGDITASISYILLQSASDTLGGSLLIQAGVSLPTGSYLYDPNAAQDVANANFQTGSGSVDVLLGVAGTVRTPDYGVRGSTSLRVPTANPNGYRFGPTLSGMAAAFISVPVSSTFLLVPSVGCVVDVMGKNSLNNNTISVTGGYVTYASASLAVRWELLLVESQFDIPVSQFQGEGTLQSNVRWSLSVGFLL
ncbi:MAG: hypothetical protein SGJ05_12430 [bacterium]|nr:hypothetical protein [bacterium]